LAVDRDVLVERCAPPLGRVPVKSSLGVLAARSLALGTPGRVCHVVSLLSAASAAIVNLSWKIRLSSTPWPVVSSLAASITAAGHQQRGARRAAQVERAVGAGEARLLARAEGALEQPREAAARIALHHQLDPPAARQVGHREGAPRAIAIGHPQIHILARKER